MASQTASKGLLCFDDNLFLHLGQVLWSWQLCTGCLSNAPCVEDSCSANRARRCQRYFQFYQAVVTTYSETSAQTAKLFKTHGDLWKAIGVLKANPAITRLQFALLLTLKNKDTIPLAGEAELLSMTTLVVKILTMIGCSALHHSSDRLEKGGYRIHWKNDVAFSKSLEDLFPTGSHPLFSYPDNDSLADAKSELRATKLKKHLGITFRATHDIQSHLRLYRKGGVLEIFHYAAFLKEQLRQTRGPGDWSSPAASIKAGALPRQLVLEVLDSLQSILFPLSDPKSKRLLQSLICTCGFDPELLRFEFSSICRVDEENATYMYLADRLSELYDELQDPRPRGWLQRQAERKSGARYIMMATLIGVLFAVLLGIASLAPMYS
ncbi:hypothetical protein EDB81DRAFT_899350 [Dactylonectria macrodidyma]|uniref:Uncharacterized protein n=1 Tax=Dactylonectria macrodidyma TaxID=307937 RepID=A0A9P9EQS1_9HYPO|nr:hypothetical protein EDB81DRAFT_899350 [Dactylonectria macrodidyma]